jgi:hypothetical protein
MFARGRKFEFSSTLDAMASDTVAKLIQIKIAISQPIPQINIGKKKTMSTQTCIDTI